MKAIGVLFFVWAALAVLVFWGWILNIMALLSTNLPILEFGIVEVVRAVGILVVPLGAFMGWFI